MKREYLENLDLGDGVKLSKEQIDGIMSENGKDIEDTKKKFGDYDDIKKQLGDANTAIGDFKKLDIEGIKKAADDWKDKFEQSEKDTAAKLDKLAYDSAADKFIDTLKPKDALSKKAILSEFVGKGFKLEGDSFVGGKEWAETFKKDNASHFEDGKPAPGIFSGKLGGGGGTPPPADTLQSAIYERYNK